MMNSLGKHILGLIFLVFLTGTSFFLLLQYNFKNPRCGINDKLTPLFFGRKQKIIGIITSSDSITGGNGTSVITTGSQEKTIALDGLSSSLYDGSLSISMDDIIESINIDDTNTLLTNTKQLEEQYKLSPNFDIGYTLLTQYIKEYDYTKAYHIFQEFDSIEAQKLPGHLTMRLLLNSPLIQKRTRDITSIEEILQNLKINNIISERDAQRYTALLYLLQGNKDEFIQTLPEYASSDPSEIAPLVYDLRNKILQASQGNDIPHYYSDGLIALGVFQYGYPRLAQELSLNLLLQYPNYTLPKQILAYSHMILHEWSQAQSYFLQLIESDKNNISTYQFFVGVTSYRLEKYTDAILYLSQIPQDKVISDSVRYIILSYIQLEDSYNIARQFRELLRFSLRPSDFLLAWEYLVFQPYMFDKNYTILQQDNLLLTHYLEQCSIQQIDQRICQIGQLAQSLMKEGYQYSEQQIKQLLSDFPKSYIYYLLGDYYFNTNDTISAQKAYISALGLTKNPQIRKKITQTIQSLL